jgi:hypothetical protein
MFNKKLKEEIEHLRKEIETLRENFWYSQYPYGEVKHRYSEFTGRGDLFYKPHYHMEPIYLNTILWHSPIKYSVKTSRDKTYLVLEYKGIKNTEPVDVKQTFIIKNGVAVELDKEVVLDSFDITGTV